MAGEDEPEQPGQRNVVRGDVSGSVVQVGRVDGDVNVHHGSPVMHVVAGGPPVAVFGAGAELSVGDQTYLVHDHLVGERRADDGAVHRQARVASAGGELGWLRQVDDRDGTGAGRPLAVERTLLRGRELPTLHQFHEDHRTTTLVTSWPRERSGRPSDSLGQLLDDGPLEDTAWLARWFAGLAGLCGTLGELHDRNLSHRALAPETLIARDDGRLVLRDLGLAARRGRPGENTGPYHAPEQRRRTAAAPGAGTDVYQVAAIAYRIVTGSVPGNAPPPMRTWHRAISDVVDAALEPDAAQRPGILPLGDALRDAGHHIR